MLREGEVTGVQINEEMPMPQPRSIHETHMNEPTQINESTLTNA